MAEINGTSGNDLLNFSGLMQQLTYTLTNPYTSKSYEIDDEFNVNNASYDGGEGYDTLLMTSDGDHLSLTNQSGVQVLFNIERIIANNEGDVINIAHDTITYGDIDIFGGRGDDILWSNAGNDYINGAFGNDIIDGGAGNDELDGGADDDQIFGGEGDDILIGGRGNDILYGGTDLGLSEYDKDFQDDITFPDLQSSVNIAHLIPPGTDALGINAENLSVSYDATATLTFRQGYAGYNNSLGMYGIAEDGTIQMVDVLWGNVKTAGYNNEYTIDLPVGESGGDFGFFIIADGYDVNGSYNGLDITADGTLSFIFDYGGVNERAATIADDGNMISLVHTHNDVTTLIQGNIYHTTARGEDNSINPDGQTHAVSGLVDPSNQDVLRIGFEDLINLGDADFEDVMFDLDIDRVHIDASEVGNDTLIGGEGDDILYGEAGDDILIIGDGFDQVYGGSGSDQFVFDIADSLIDKIHDFEAGLGADTLNITDILSGFDPESSSLSDFVQLGQNGSDTELHIDSDGAGTNANFVAIAVFEGGLDTTLADLINNGNIVADNSVVV